MAPILPGETLKLLNSPLQTKCDASKSVSPEVEDLHYLDSGLFSAVCSDGGCPVHTMPRRHCSSQAPLSRKRGGSVYIEWCVYVCGFRGSHVDVPLAKQLQQKHLSVVSFSPLKLANAKIKPFIFFFLENQFTNTLLNILL